MAGYWCSCSMLKSDGARTPKLQYQNQIMAEQNDEAKEALPPYRSPKAPSTSAPFVTSVHSNSWSWQWKIKRIVILPAGSWENGSKESRHGKWAYQILLKLAIIRKLIKHSHSYRLWRKEGLGYTAGPGMSQVVCQPSQGTTSPHWLDWLLQESEQE